MEWERAGQQVSSLQIKSGSHVYPEQTFNGATIWESHRTPVGTFYSGRTQVKDTPGETDTQRRTREEPNWPQNQENQADQRKHDDYDQSTSCWRSFMKEIQLKVSDRWRFSSLKSLLNHKNSHKFTFLTTQNSIFFNQQLHRLLTFEVRTQLKCFLSSTTIFLDVVSFLFSFIVVQGCK